MSIHQATEDFELSGAAAEVAREAEPRPRGNGDGVLTKGLGWFSVGLGVAEVTAPGLMARLIGVRDDTDNRELLRAAGMREIASGVGILTRERPAGWVWARVGGDVMDLAMLGSAMASDDSDKRRLGAAAAAVAGVTALDVFCGRRLTSETGESSQHRVSKAITINRTAAEVYQVWRNFETLPRFMDHLEAVRMTGRNRSHWVAKGPAGTTIEWDAETIEDRPNERIAWRSTEDAQVPNTGSVTFREAPGRQGTEVRVLLQFNPPAGEFGEMFAWLFGESPEQQLEDDLRRLKQYLETGEISRTSASEGFFGMTRPAQPEGMRGQHLARGGR